MAATTQGAIIGRYVGTSWATAFTNPIHLDIFQVIQPNDGSIIFSIDYLGTAHSSPVSPTGQALIGKFSGATLAAAFSNPSHLDLLQIYEDNSGSIVKYVDYLGVSH
jgi:hypothetical protein